MKVVKFIHRWFGVVAAFFMLMFALSGIVLNHRDLVSTLSISRNCLPNDYRFQNWNLAAVKGATHLSPDSILVYGNIGVWLTDSIFSRFTDFNKGIRKGIDNRKVFHIVKTRKGNTYAAMLSGLYHFNGQEWIKINLGHKEKQIRAIETIGDTLMVLTRSSVYIGFDNPNNPQLTRHFLPRPQGYQARTSLFRALWLLHSGEMFGPAGIVLVDLMGVILAFLSITGFIWFFTPRLIKRLKNRLRAKRAAVKANRFSIKWHNLLGIWAALFLLVSAVTGAFLRPPLLIAIVQSSIPNIKGTVLDNENPWYDKLRDFRYNHATGNLLISTSDGFFISNKLLSDSLTKVKTQPPVSVMGINVFEQTDSAIFLVGSFSGIFRWNIEEETIFDFITNQPVASARGMARPFGNMAVAGYIGTPNEGSYIFSYDTGVISHHREDAFPAMPKYIKDQSPLSLWNLALEIHVARIYSIVFGKYSILLIPLMALMLFSMVTSGVFLWIKDHGRKKRIKKNCNKTQV